MRHEPTAISRRVPTPSPRPDPILFVAILTLLPYTFCMGGSKDTTPFYTASLLTRPSSDYLVHIYLAPAS
jgi:hypothetical protein